MIKKKIKKLMIKLKKYYNSKMKNLYRINKNQNHNGNGQEKKDLK